MENLTYVVEKTAHFCCDTHLDIVKDIVLYLPGYFQKFLGNQNCTGKIVVQGSHMYTKHTLNSS